MDNIKSRMYITLFCYRQNMNLLNYRVCVKKPKAIFVLEKKHNFLSINYLRVCDFLMDILRT
jgi:hypothetical protein